jgi:signal transduction histidine kinase
LLHGYVATLLTPGDLLEQGLRYLRPHGIDLYLFDRSAAERDAFLYYHRSRMNRAPGTKTGADLARPRVPLQYAATIAAGGREWELICTPIEGGVEHTWESWGILAVGLGLTAAVAAWLRSVLSHTEAVERKVVRRTRELAAARDQALESSRLKSQFLANMSHEIRTPMNGILGFTQLALDTRLDELQRDYLETVETSARSLLRVINDILDLSKIEAGRVDLEHTPFALRACLEDAVRTVSAEAARKGLLLDCAIDARAPETLVGDAARLRQVLLNLLGNAVKFTASGWVRAEVVARDGELDFVVRDTGPGVPAEKQQVIFEAFRQADDSVTRRFGGTGLGLTISARLVELMGGRIWMESRPGAGSAFHVTLPAPARESGGASRASSEAAVPAGNGR